jgi:hypothetical protein
VHIHSPGFKLLLEFAMLLGVGALFAGASFMRDLKSPCRKCMPLVDFAPLADPHSTHFGGPLLALPNTLSLSP